MKESSCDVLRGIAILALCSVIRKAEARLVIRDLPTHLAIVRPREPPRHGADLSRGLARRRHRLRGFKGVGHELRGVRRRACVGVSCQRPAVADPLNLFAEAAIEIAHSVGEDVPCVGAGFGWGKRNTEELLDRANDQILKLRPCAPSISPGLRDHVLERDHGPLLGGVFAHRPAVELADDIIDPGAFGGSQEFREPVERLAGSGLAPHVMPDLVRNGEWSLAGLIPGRVDQDLVALDQAKPCFVREIDDAHARGDAAAEPAFQGFANHIGVVAEKRGGGCGCAG